MVAHLLANLGQLQPYADADSVLAKPTAGIYGRSIKTTIYLGFPALNFLSFFPLLIFIGIKCFAFTFAYVSL